MITTQSNKVIENNFFNIFATPSNGTLIFLIMMGAVLLILIFIAWKAFSIYCYPKLQQTLFQSLKNMAGRCRYSSYTTGNKPTLIEKIVNIKKEAAATSRNDNKVLVDLERI